jgi:hypothetical protein
MIKWRSIDSLKIKFFVEKPFSWTIEHGRRTIEHLKIRQGLHPVIGHSKEKTGWSPFMKIYLLKHLFLMKTFLPLQPEFKG